MVQDLTCESLKGINWKGIGTPVTSSAASELAILMSAYTAALSDFEKEMKRPWWKGLLSPLNPTWRRKAWGDKIYVAAQTEAWLILETVRASGKYGLTPRKEA